MANQNSITPHVWISRVAKLYLPRHLRVRPRPIGRGRPSAARGGAGLRDLLAELGLNELGQDVRLEGIPHRRAARR